MTRRAALALAAGVLAALGTGILAVSLGASTPSGAVTDPDAGRQPAVRTVIETVTIDRTADPAPGMAAPPPADTAIPQHDWDGDDRDDEHEGEHEDDPGEDDDHDDEHDDDEHDGD